MLLRQLLSSVLRPAAAAQGVVVVVVACCGARTASKRVFVQRCESVVVCFGGAGRRGEGQGRGGLALRAAVKREGEVVCTAGAAGGAAAYTRGAAVHFSMQVGGRWAYVEAHNSHSLLALGREVTHSGRDGAKPRLRSTLPALLPRHVRRLPLPPLLWRNDPVSFFCPPLLGIRFFASAAARSALSPCVVAPRGPPRRVLRPLGLPCGAWRPDTAQPAAAPQHRHRSPLQLVAWWPPRPGVFQCQGRASCPSARA